MGMTPSLSSSRPAWRFSHRIGACHHVAVRDYPSDRHSNRVHDLLPMVQIAGDSLTKVADENWSAAAQLRGQVPAFNPTLVEEIYKRELNGISKLPPKLKRVMLLEISQYLENYLWPNFDAETSSDSHILSILVGISS